MPAGAIAMCAAIELHLHRGLSCAAAQRWYVYGLSWHEFIDFTTIAMNLAAIETVENSQCQGMNYASLVNFGFSSMFRSS